MSDVFEGLKQNIKQKAKLIVFNVDGDVSLIELQKLPPDYQKTTKEDIVVLELSDVLGLVDKAKAELQKRLQKKKKEVERYFATLDKLVSEGKSLSKSLHSLNYYATWKETLKEFEQLLGETK